MKTSLLKAIAIFCGIFAAGNSDIIANTPGNTGFGNTVQVTEDIDTLSYITGYQVSQDIHGTILPQLKLNYETIYSTIDALFATDKSITVAGVTISPENINELGRRYLNEDVHSRVRAAMTDSTATAEIFSDPTEKEIVSTLIGADYAYRMAFAPYPIEKSSFMLAISESHNGNARFTMNDCNQYMEYYFTVVIPRTNRVESENWLATIKEQEGVESTPSGILYKIVEPGDANVKAINDEDVVKVIYTGTTRNGKVFDSNRWADMTEERKQMVMLYSPEQANVDSPIEFPLNRVIKGWTEGMKLIGKGGRIILWIPAHLAYGERGAGNDIGPNEALCFDVELLEVTNK